MAIILVNLTFCDADLRKELVTRPNIELMESLAFALRVASFTQEEYDIRQPLSVPNENKQYSPSYLLASVLQEDTINYNHTHTLLIDPSLILYPETARWCLSAIKNLSRPCKDYAVADSLVNSGILILIIRFISFADHANSINAVQPVENIDFEGIEMSHEDIDAPESEVFTNDPTGWQSNSMQDAALFIVMNLAAMKSSRDVILEANGVPILTRITEHNKQNRRKTGKQLSDEQKQLEFQRLKAVSSFCYGR
jgi:hypothetical protein